MTVAGKLGPTGGRSSDDAEKGTSERWAQVGCSLRHRRHDQPDRLLVVSRHSCHQLAPRKHLVAPDGRVRRRPAVPPNTSRLVGSPLVSMPIQGQDGGKDATPGCQGPHLWAAGRQRDRQPTPAPRGPRRRPSPPGGSFARSRIVRPRPGSPSTDHRRWQMGCRTGAVDVDRDRPVDGMVAVDGFGSAWSPPGGAPSAGVLGRVGAAATRVDRDAGQRWTGVVPRVGRDRSRRPQGS